jgi:hypothetical protein
VKNKIKKPGKTLFMKNISLAKEQNCCPLKNFLSDKCEDHFQNLIKRLMLEIWSQAWKKIFVPGTKACIFILAEKMRFSTGFPIEFGACKFSRSLKKQPSELLAYRAN